MVVRRTFDVRGRWEQRGAEDTVLGFISDTLHKILLSL